MVLRVPWRNLLRATSSSFFPRLLLLILKLLNRYHLTDQPAVIVAVVPEPADHPVHEGGVREAGRPAENELKRVFHRATVEVPRLRVYPSHLPDPSRDLPPEESSPGEHLRIRGPADPEPVLTSQVSHGMHLPPLPRPGPVKPHDLKLAFELGLRSREV